MDLKFTVFQHCTTCARKGHCQDTTRPALLRPGLPLHLPSLRAVCSPNRPRGNLPESRGWGKIRFAVVESETVRLCQPKVHPRSLEIRPGERHRTRDRWPIRFCGCLDVQCATCGGLRMGIMSVLSCMKFPARRLLTASSHAPHFEIRREVPCITH